MLFTNYTKKTDEQLMISIQDGDHRAFSHLYDRYASRLNSFFYRMLWSDSSKAEDCVHDLFSKIVERPQLFKQGNMVRPWLFQIASNMCKNAYRKRSFEVEYLNQLQENKISESSMENRVDEAILTDQIHRSLGKLDEDRRTLFLLRYQQEMSIEELADIFGIPKGTVKSRLFHVKKYIADTMKEKK